MIFTNHQLLNKDQIEVLGTQKLDLNDLIEDFAVTPENKIIFTGKIPAVFIKRLLSVPFS